ncbi:MAG: acetoin dehydrogenase dihydrolipoyllysine-residue acetyltransferase subunit [Rhizobiaceae bacterium]
MERIRALTMPKWGMTMTEGTIASWLVDEGQAIESGNEYVEIETEKITNVVEADKPGKLRRIVAHEGQKIPCGGLIAVMADDNVSDEELEAFLDDFEPVEQDEGAAAALQRHKVDVDGLKINIVSSRGADGQDGTPLVLIHGFGADARSWLFNQEALASKLPVHSVELPSHGESDVRASAMTLAEMARIIAVVLGEIAPDGAHLAGHSLGGRVALRLAADKANKVRSLVLLAPAGFGQTANPEFIGQFIAAGRRRPMKAALQMLVKDTDLVNSEMIEQTLSYKHIDGVEEALRATQQANFSEGQVNEGTEAELTSLDCPVLVIWGEDDRVLASAGAEFARGKAEIVIVAGAGHLVQMEASGEVNQAIEAFLEARS